MSKNLLNQADFSDYAQLFYYSFNIKPDEVTQKITKSMYDHAKVYGLKDDEQLMASVMSVPLTSNFFGKTYKITSFANVMSAPEYSNRKVISLLTKEAIEDMHDDGVVLSYLNPFSYDYYRRFGYEQVFELLRLEIPFEKFTKRHADKGSIKRYKFTEVITEVKEIFDEHNTRGGIVEENWLWDISKLRYPDYYAALTFDDSGKIDGYLVYSLEQTEFVVHDLIYQNADSFLQMIHFINKHRSSYKRIIINSSNVNLKPNVFVTDTFDVTTTIEPFMMVRIINLEAFVKNYPTAVADLKNVKIKVDDDLIWNNHIWNLNINNREVNFKIENDKNYDIELNIQTLTKVMFGYQSLQDLYLIGEVSGDLSKIKQLDSIFIKEKSQVSNEF